MTIAEDVLDRMKALNISAARAANDVQGKDDLVDEVDRIYKFYYFKDGSKLGVRIRENAHDPRWPTEQQQAFAIGPHPIYD